MRRSSVRIERPVDDVQMVSTSIVRAGRARVQVPSSHPTRGVAQWIEHPVDDVQMVSTISTDREGAGSNPAAMQSNKH